MKKDSSRVLIMMVIANHVLTIVMNAWMIGANALIVSRTESHTPFQVFMNVSAKRTTLTMVKSASFKGKNVLMVNTLTLTTIVRIAVLTAHHARRPMILELVTCAHTRHSLSRVTIVVVLKACSTLAANVSLRSMDVLRDSSLRTVSVWRAQPIVKHVKIILALARCVSRVMRCLVQTASVFLLPMSATSNMDLKRTQLVA